MSEKNLKYEPVRLDVDDRVRFEQFDPSREHGAVLVEAGVRHLGINWISGRFRAWSDCCPTHLLHVTISGEIVCEAGDTPLAIREGEMLVAPARGAHRLRVTKTPCTVAWIHFWQTPQWEFLRATGRRVQKLLNPREFTNVFEAVLRLARREQPRDEEALYHYAEILLILLSAELDPLQTPSARAVQMRLSRLWDAVREEPAHDWSVPELARRVGVSPGYLPELCRTHFGVTPREKVAALRIEAAQHLLRMTTRTLADIAAQVGYATEYAFSDAFKRVTGCRPGAFRRSTWKEQISRA
jgi:AraC-like DNA-binding protein/nitrite reductase/ring-hydroxylating ferredoxin subunit